VGSAVDLSRRLKDYYSPSKLKKKTNSYICNALIHHTHLAFSLTILEYIDISNLDFENIRKLVLSREQYYIDTLVPEYNIQKIAGSSLGKTHSAETKIKISEALKGKKHTEETKEKMSESKSGQNNPNFGKARSIETKAKMSATRGISIFAYSENGLLINKFPSAREAGKYFNTHSKTILKYCSNGKLFKEQWILSNKDSSLCEGDVK
jgi:group I intron endonuclease